MLKTTISSVWTTVFQDRSLVSVLNVCTEEDLTTAQTISPSLVKTTRCANQYERRLTHQTDTFTVALLCLFHYRND